MIALLDGDLILYRCAASAENDPYGIAQSRVNELLEKNKTVGLTAEENAEMERYMTVEHIVRLAKAKALQKINA